MSRTAGLTRPDQKRQAISLAARIPSACFGTIEVRPIWNYE